jgi:hypothetical protein
MRKMYKLKLKNNFATITKNGKEIEPLSGLFMANQSEVNELAELVRLANKSFQQTDIPHPDVNSAKGD